MSQDNIRPNTMHCKAHCNSAARAQQGREASNVNLSPVSFEQPMCVTAETIILGVLNYLGRCTVPEAMQVPPGNNFDCIFMKSNVAQIVWPPAYSACRGLVVMASLTRDRTRKAVSELRDLAAELGLAKNIKFPDLPEVVFRATHALPQDAQVL